MNNKKRSSNQILSQKVRNQRESKEYKRENFHLSISILNNK